MDPRRDLERLADLYDIETSYQDVHGQRRYASDTALLRMLQCLGAPIHSPADVADALLSRELDCWRQRCDPVLVVQQQTQPVLRLRVPAAEVDRRFRAQIELEQSESVALEGLLADLPTSATHEVAAQRFVEKTLRFDRALSCGYHHARVELATGLSEALLLCPPSRAWAPRAPAWGVFAPVYALHGERSLGGGDLHDLEALIDWVGSLGATVIGTLPLLPTFLDEPFDPSPYAPISRLFWNELYLDVRRLAETAVSDSTRERFASRAFREEVEELREQPLVDYRRQMALKRQVLEQLAAEFFEQGGSGRTEFEGFIEARPRVRDYARFRAATELAQEPWQAWSPEPRAGKLRDADLREADVRYHLYVQWRCSQQMSALGIKARSLGLGLYLDLPLGVHDAGYDVWRERDVFLHGCSLGAPPDLLFTKGQHWGITPLHPMGLRQQKHRYFIDCIRHHMACAGALRIDHVMGLHRVYCIPSEMPPLEGVYVRYRPQELYAVLALESTRAKTLVVGEDLGIVPDEVRQTMQRVGISRMHVLQYELEGAPRDVFADMPGEVVVSVNTHDTAPFSTWWDGSEIEDRLASGLLTQVEAAAARAKRETAREMILERLAARERKSSGLDEPLEALEGILAEYGSSPALVVLVTLEDLWLERRPQNVPGTGHERPNWRSRCRYSLEAMKTMPSALRVLERIDEERRSAHGRRKRE